MVTGGTRVTRLCSPGTINPFTILGCLGSHDGISPFEKLSSAPLMLTPPQARPQASTNTTSNRYGTHATKTLPIEWPCIAVVAGLSPSSLKMVVGFQNFNTSTMQPMQLSELRMSVRSGPM